MRQLFLIGAVSCGIVTPALADQAEAPAAPPAAIQKLLDCRSLGDATARLACFDAEVGGLGASIERRDVVVVDRAQIRTARRSLFGLTLPNFNLFGDRKSEQEKGETEAFSELNATIRDARRRGDRNWTIILDDGAKWIQTDAKDLVRDPRPGMKIRIRRAAMSSFLANVEGQTAIRMRREN